MARTDAYAHSQRRTAPTYPLPYLLLASIHLSPVATSLPSTERRYRYCSCSSCVKGGFWKADQCSWLGRKEGGREKGGNGEKKEEVRMPHRHYPLHSTTHNSQVFGALTPLGEAHVHFGADVLAPGVHQRAAVVVRVGQGRIPAVRREEVGGWVRELRWGFDSVVYYVKGSEC